MQQACNIACSVKLWFPVASANIFGSVSSPANASVLKQVVARLLIVNTYPVNAKLEENDKNIKIVFHRVIAVVVYHY